MSLILKFDTKFDANFDSNFDAKIIVSVASIFGVEVKKNALCLDTNILFSTSVNIHCYRDIYKKIITQIFLPQPKPLTMLVLVVN